MNTPSGLANRRMLNSAAEPLIEACDLSVAFTTGPNVLDGINLTVERGDLIGIVGPSGSGKSTLLRVLLGSLKPSQGTVARKRAMTIGFVPQVERIDWNFPVTVSECVGMARSRGWKTPWITKHERVEILDVLERLGLHGLADRHIRDLSGGQQQRVFLARALFTGAETIFLDEPTSGLDVKTRHEVLHLLADLNGEGVTVVLSTHDLNGIAAHLPIVVCLNTRILGAGSPEDVLIPSILEQTYGSPMKILEHAGMRVVVDAGFNSSLDDSSLDNSSLDNSSLTTVQPKSRRVSGL